MSASDRERPLKIVFTGRHFLYTSLYYCCSNDFFGRLPPNIHIEPQLSVGRTDESALRELMDDREEDILFALCDPAVIMNHGSLGDDIPIPIAAVVTNTAFWAINHGLFQSRKLGDLAKYKTIVSFGPGSTSHAIASRAFLLANKDPSIKVVDMEGQELQAITEDRGLVALSPDVVMVARLASKRSREYSVDLEIGVTPEYHNVLVTALLTRKSTISKHLPLVRSVIAGLQCALLMCIYEDHSIVEAADDRFEYDREDIIDAFRRANDSELFPANARIKRLHWTNACKAHHEAKGEAVDDSSLGKFDTFYDDYIEPVNKKLDSAFREGIAVYSGSKMEQTGGGRALNSRPLAFAVILIFIGVMLDQTNLFHGLAYTSGLLGISLIAILSLDRLAEALSFKKMYTCMPRIGCSGRYSSYASRLAAGFQIKDLSLLE